DLYYSITVPPGYTLTMGLTGSNYDSVHAMFYGNCTTSTQIVCTDSEVINHTWVNTTGTSQTVYWVQDSWNVTPGFFILGWNLVAPPIAITSVSPSQVCTATIEDTDVTLIGQYFN